MFATVACFPNLPGYEYLMQQPEGQNLFSGLPVLLNHRRFNDIYIYNGHFSWDNQQGFFRSQGMSNFIGRDDFRDPIFIDPTWGVSDEDMFNRALQELDRMPTDKPFLCDLADTVQPHTVRLAGVSYRSSPSPVSENWISTSMETLYCRLGLRGITVWGTRVK